MSGLKTDCKNILELQKVDSEIDKNNQALNSIEEKILFEKISQKIKELENKKTQFAKLYDAEKLNLDRQNGRLEILSKKIAGEEKKLFSGSVSNPKELSALQAEIASLGRQKDEAETAVLEQMELASSLEAEIERINKAVEENKDEAAKKQNIWLEKESRFKEIISKLQVQREQKAADIDKELLSDYEDVRAGKNGVGAGALVGDICQACNVQLAATDLERIRNCEGYEYCPFCGRILIVGSKE